MQDAKTFLAATLGLFLMVLGSVAEADLTQAWVARYDAGQGGDDVALDMAVDGVGNTYVTGYSFGGSTGYDYATVKYDPDGNQLWVARYDGGLGSDDYAYCVEVDSGGNAYVSGNTYRGGGYSFDYATVKYGQNGQQLWAAQYHHGYDWVTDMAIDQAGNVSVTGFSYIEGLPTNYNYLTVRYGPNGNLLWAAIYDAPWTQSQDKSYGAAVDANGNTYVAGSGWSAHPYDYTTLKYGPSGNQIWAAMYNSPYNLSDEALDIAVGRNGSVCVTGFSYGQGTGKDFVTVKCDPGTGDTVWARRYDYVSDDIGEAVTADDAGNVYVSGSSSRAANLDYATVKYDGGGGQLWVARYDGPGNADDDVSALAVDHAGNAYVTGYSYGIGTSRDYATVEYDSDGNQVWVGRQQWPRELP